MLPQWIIEKKRDGISLTDDEIRFFINGYTDESIPDYQMAAMAMAIYFQGMTSSEIATLTDVMMNSGDLVDTSSITNPKADKHSTGGIGDKVSLILAPLVACCDIAVPMISGRGLGITGGTLDKMESIPGYRTDLSEKEFLHVLDTCGCSIIGQTGQLAPADKKLYALRDVTGTVPSIPLITASIMSKKLAEGMDALVLDVKYGNGAFMKTPEQALQLAQSMVNVGVQMGKGMTALLTDMNQPLGRSAGNALEVIESIEALKNNGSEDLTEITVALSAHMLLLTGKATTMDEARTVLHSHLASGKAYQKFLEMVRLQGGDTQAIEEPSGLPSAQMIEPYPSPASGYIAAASAEKIGQACAVLGAGRTKTDDKIDFAVGIDHLIKVGESVEKDQPLLRIHANNVKQLDEARSYLSDAFSIVPDKVTPPVLIRDVIQPGD